MRRHVLAIGLGGVLLASAGAHAGAGHDKGHGHGHGIDYSNVDEHAFGKASDPARAARTIDVDMHDTMRFQPEVIRVKRGEPLRFRVRNEGDVLHEMVLGTRAELEQHAEMMKKFPGMEHEELHMVHVQPDQEGTLGWTFTEAGEYFYGCLLPGHYEAGMLGRVIVE